ncbi:MAG: hypothetical protein HWD60_03075 [Defluviicoccus sp.]|nr:MAG: hypothetical protein HWD60_03075 [Defluviicoccus sp.]
MPDIARLDATGVAIAVDTVSSADHRTDPVARTVALPPNHDLRQRLGQYRWDFLRATFLPVAAEPLDVAERETPGLVEGLVAFVEQLERQLGLELPAPTQKAIAAWRRSVDGRRSAADAVR